MLSIISHNHENQVIRECATHAESLIHENSNKWIDIDLGDLPKKQASELLNTLGVHPLAITDIFRPKHPPKFEAFDDNLFILYRGIQNSGELLEFTHQTISFYIIGNNLITTHAENSIGIEKTVKRYLNTEKPLNPIDLAIKIMLSSSLVYLSHLLDFEEEIAELEDELIEKNNDDVMAKIVNCRSRLIKLCRIFKYHRDCAKQLLDHIQNSETPNNALLELKHETIDLNDRFDRLYTLADMHYNLCGDLLDGYLSISSHQLNNTMRVLTVITAIFVPLGFLAGLYGMNFEFIPELKLRYGYFYLVAFMLLISSSLIIYFKKQKWL